MQLTSGIASAFFNLIETFEGGRVAALAGRFMANIKNETISYLLMAVKDNRLCYMNDQGILVDLVKMCETKMGKIIDYTR